MVLISLAAIAGVVYSIKIIADAVVRILTAEGDPPWVTIVLAVLTPLLGTGTAGGLIVYWIRRFRNHVGTHSDRLKRLEQGTDPNRTSSELERDGTHALDN